MPGAVFGAHGHTFTVTASDQELEELVREVFATLLVEEEPRGGYDLYRDLSGGCILRYGDETIGGRPSAEHALLLLQWHVNQMVIERASSTRTTLHASAALSPDGTGILLAAPMESGKTTTVAGLLAAGWTYLTDEAAAVDADGCVHAYPKPLTLDEGSWSLFPGQRPAGWAEDASWLVPATTFGRPVGQEGRIGAFVFPRYQAGAATELERVTPSAAAMELAHSAFHFDCHAARDLRTVSSLARLVPAHRLTISSLARAVELLADLAVRLENGDIT